MAAVEPKVEVGQVWRRNSDGTLIRIAAERTGDQGRHFDDWVWKKVGDSHRHNCYGRYILSNYKLVTP